MPSTVIRRFAYDPARATLTVTFVTGRRYAYRDVPEAVAAAMRRSFAKGQFFNAEIRDAYRFRRLPDEGADDGDDEVQADALSTSSAAPRRGKAGRGG